MIYLASNRESEYKKLNYSSFQLADLNTFIKWRTDKYVFQLDTETLFIEDSPDVNEDRKLVLIQIGDIESQDQWLIEWTLFNDPDWKFALKLFFENTDNAFIAHNAFFEYTVIKTQLGIRVENIHDTFLMSIILNTGYELEKGYHSLAGCLNRFFGIEIDKSEQKGFTFDLLTESQIHYASADIIHLYDLFLKLKELLISWNLWFLYVRVEREVLKAFADMGINELGFDTEHWTKLSDNLLIDDKNFEKELNNIVMNDLALVNYLKNSNKVIGSYLIQPKNQVILNWGSNVVRKSVLTKLIPDLISIDKFTKPELNKLYKANVLTSKENKILNLYLKQNFTLLNRYLCLNYKEWLSNNGYFLKNNDILINWNSNNHKLFIFQFYYPNLINTNSKSLNRIHANPLIVKYKQYVKVHKAVTTYGESFIINNVNRRGNISPRGCRQIINTGRIAYGILLQLPAQERYRNAFLPPEEDWVLVDSDWSGAELAIMAFLAQEESLLSVIRNGQDAHMFVAQKLFPREWEAAAESGCIQLSTGMKCTCPGHEKLRKSGKTFNFGIPFGMTYVGLAERLDKSRSEAKIILDFYYETFPALKKFFNESETSSIKNNFIIGPKPTNRIRFFHSPANEGERQAIGREGKNFPIQSCNAEMLKIALIKLRRYILENNFPAKLHLPVHDEILSSCHKSVAEQWANIQTQAMQEAADMFIEPGLLKTDTKILLKWTK